MDQIVTRPRVEPAAPHKAEVPDVAAALRLDGKGRGRRRRWPYVLAFLLATAGVAAGYAYMGSTSQAIAYATVPAERADLTVEVSATGNLQPLTKVDISSELSGVVRSVTAEENQRVKAGDVLAELDKTRLSAQVERGEASVEAARARVTDAQTTLRETEKALARAEQLAKRGMTTEQALETATAARDRAASAVAIAEANLAVAVADLKLQQADLEKSTIYAPIDGIVLTRSVDPGQTVASSLQAPVLFVIAAELENMELIAAIDEADIGSVKPDQKAVFTVDAFPERKFDAEIRDIAYASVTTEGVVTYDARLGVDNAELLLRPGMTATVSVVTREAKDVITVPAAAFRFRPPAVQPRAAWSLQSMFMPRLPRSGGQRATTVSTDGTRTLYVLKDGQPVPVKVKTGSTDGERTEIVSGLEAGDLVVTGTTNAAK